MTRKTASAYNLFDFVGFTGGGILYPRVNVAGAVADGTSREIGGGVGITKVYYRRWRNTEGNEDLSLLLSRSSPPSALNLFPFTARSLPTSTLPVSWASRCAPYVSDNMLMLIANLRSGGNKYTENLSREQLLRGGDNRYGTHPQVSSGISSLGGRSSDSLEEYLAIAPQSTKPSHLSIASF